MMFRRIQKAALSLIVAFATTAAWADAKTLIDYQGNQPTAGLAKSWKKVSDGKYEFTLDTNAKVGKDTPLTPELVKDSLESKLGKSMSVKVTEKSKDTVLVSYSGKEDQFLKKVAKTRIKDRKSVSLALESSVSDGGIRAKTAERDPKSSELKVRFLGKQGQHLKALVVATGPDHHGADVASGKIIMVSGQGTFAPKKGETFFFTPKEKKGDVWVGSGFSIQ